MLANLWPRSCCRGSLFWSYKYIWNGRVILKGTFIIHKMHSASFLHQVSNSTPLFPFKSPRQLIDDSSWSVLSISYTQRAVPLIYHTRSAFLIVFIQISFGFNSLSKIPYSFTDRVQYICCALRASKQTFLNSILVRLLTQRSFALTFNSPPFGYFHLLITLSLIINFLLLVPRFLLK